MSSLHIVDPNSAEKTGIFARIWKANETELKGVVLASAVGAVALGALLCYALISGTSFGQAWNALGLSNNIIPLGIGVVVPLVTLGIVKWAPSILNMIFCSGSKEKELAYSLEAEGLKLNGPEKSEKPDMLRSASQEKIVIEKVDVEKKA